MHWKRVTAAAVMLPILAQSATAQSTSITFTGTVANLCVLTLSTAGTLGLSTDGKTLSSAETGGVKAVLAVVASGSSPTLTFGAPTMTGPTATVAGSAVSIAYTSPGGAAQAFTSSSTTYSMNRLLDVLTVDGRAVNNNGFATGAYGIAATATCQQ